MTRITFPLNHTMQGDAVALLQDALQQCLDRGVLLAADDVARRELGLALRRERTAQAYDSATAKLVSLFQDAHALPANGEVDQQTAKALNERLQQWGLLDAEFDGGRRVEGQVWLARGVPASRVKLRLYRIDFGGKATLLDETSSLADGQYALRYTPDGDAATLQVRTVNAAGEEIPLSHPLDGRNGGLSAAVNLIAPDTVQPLGAEYRRLAGDLTAHVGDMNTLADARESDDRQDLTVLNRATGWDARLIALASTAVRLSADADVQLPPEPLYGLLRAGLPADKLMLAQVDPAIAEQALKTVRDSGIVELNDAQIADFKGKFSAFATKVRLNVPAPGSRATYGQLLGASGVSAEAQAKFAPVYLAHRGTGAQLWEEARKAGLDNAQIAKLQLQGKLAFLAGNSAGMTARLLQKGIDDPADLVGHDFHRADTWIAEILSHADIPMARRDNLTDADRQKLDAELPSRYFGARVEDRLQAYADDMARKVSRSYPTQVVARLVEQNVIELPASREQTVTLLRNAAVQGFRLGATPVDRFLETHAGVGAGLTSAELKGARQQLKTLQRVYQVTPSHDAMPVLLSLGMTSAYDITSYPEQQFAALFEAKYVELHGKQPQKDEARLVYRKATQVSSVTFNLFAIAGRVDAQPAVAGLSAPVEVRERVRDGLIRQFPTMESLFGSMDFCDCEHCCSVLSPAAYLVDLMQFVDPDPREWDNFLAQWKATHGGRDYPHPKPYDVLIERRPDLPHIALTCENTHTALPYIDIVNEILEYYVANGKLEEAAARDTGAATTAELLAEPQNVIASAYGALRQAPYPLTLPFDLWIETVRQFCDRVQMPLARVMEWVRETDDLFAPAPAIDRFTVFMESLGLSRAEVDLFTNPAPLDSWHTLYGFENAAEATTEAVDATTGQRIDLHAAKTLCRRLGVTYRELSDILQTGFVNPKIAQLAVLYKVGVDIQQARLYRDHQTLLTADPAMLSPDDQKLRLEIQALDVTLGAAQPVLQSIPFDAVLVLADPSAGGNFDLTTLRYADGNAADAFAFLKINLFVRLWRRLGWSIEETGRALDAFVPANAPFEAATLDKQPLKTALIYLAHLDALHDALGLGAQGRVKLLTLWTDLATTGQQPLYEQVFLGRGALTSDPAFDHPLGQYLSQNVPKLQLHVPALRAALGLTLEDISCVLEDVGESFEQADLSLANVSRLYRYGLLAKALKLTVRQLIALKQFSGLDPFTPLQRDPLVDAPNAIALDVPFTQALRFVEIARVVKESGLSIEDLDYVLRHRIEPAGKYRDNPEAVASMLKTLGDSIRAIRSGPAPADAGTVTGEEQRQHQIAQFVVQETAAFLGSDTALLAALLTDATLLGSPEPLVQALIAAADHDPAVGLVEATRVVERLAKTLLLADRLGLSEAEARYLLGRENSLRTLPTQPSDDTDAGARERFNAFLRWVAYVRLRHELGGNSADLIAALGAGGSTAPNAFDSIVTPLIARLTRRDEATVKATALTLAGSSAPSIGDVPALQRLWQALQLVSRFGVPVALLRDWIHVVVSTNPDAPRFETAREVREAIKSGLDAAAWTKAAQPIFDRLRARQRDALVAFAVHRGHFGSREQLYEHFLVDPGMEPVVQTSRIRLAIASVQLFIQRSLLNLEPQVHPSVVNAGRWEWMKRYRVWEANRKIFLFPENWLEPEFRDDKTHLFAELEGTLLQGDVSNDLAEDAFLNYMRTLDELARLEIVGMHLEDGPPAAGTLHVIGRTYSKPHKYFYRRYAREMWTPWEPLRIEVKGDHLAPVMWRNRLYLFWVTFMDKPVREPQFGSSTGNQSLAQVKLSSVINDVSASGRQKQLDVQLHWSEYLDGEWSAPESGDPVPVTTVTRVPGHWERARVNDPRPTTADGHVWVQERDATGPLLVASTFDDRTVFIHVSKEPYEDGDERGVYVHLRGGGVDQSFYMAGRNAEPETAGGREQPLNPLTSASRVVANRYAGSAALKVEFRRRISTADGHAPVDSVQTSGILQRCNAYTVLPCDSAALPVTGLDAGDESPPVQAAIERGLPEIAALMRPVFYQDNAHTFFVKPTVTERTIEEWQEWVTPTPPPDPGWRDPRWWRDLAVVAEIPRKPAPDPETPGAGVIGPESVIHPGSRRDWLVGPGTTVEFDGGHIGSAGRLVRTIDRTRRML